MEHQNYQNKCFKITYTLNKVLVKKREQVKMSFETWMDYINYLLFVRHGFEIKDLPDEPFMDYYVNFEHLFVLKKLNT